MKPKKVIQLLKREAKKLPEETYFAIDLFHKPQKINGEWKRGIVTEHKVNHGRRIKKIYKKWGMPAVNAYFYVKGQLVQQKQTENEKNNDEPVADVNINEQSSTEKGQE